MSQICYETVKVTTTGAAGSASGSVETIPLHGFLLDLYIDYHASAPATTDVTITDPVFGIVFQKNNSNYDSWRAPRLMVYNQGASATGQYDLIPLNSKLTVAVAQADALTDCVVITIRYMTP